MRRLIGVVCVLSLLGAVAGTSFAGRRRVPKLGTAKDFSDWAVEEAIKRAIKHLWSKQNEDGTWPSKHNKGYPTGATAVAAYALLASGVNPQDQRMQKTLDWLSKNDSKKTYSLGIRCYVWYLANRTTLGKYRDQLKKDAKLLYDSHNNGHYHYVSAGKPEGSYDNSCSQYGVLGVWAAAADGSVEVPYDYWQTVMKHWMNTQGPGGGWEYRGKPAGDGGRPTMVAAGVASLFVCYDYSGLADRSPGVAFPPIVKGLQWLDKKFSVRSSHQYYYLYGIERVGLASGYKYFGVKDWYKLGASFLLNGQKGGGWGNVTDTAFALLFLIRGQHPVLFNKLKHGGDWNRRSRDMASVTRWISNNFETTVNWQIINMDTKVTEWHDASVLYITGTLDPKFTEEQLKKIRTYILQGGTIFTVVQSGGAKFKQAMEKAYKTMFPKYGLRELPKDDEIYSSVYFKIDKKPNFKILSNGVRPLVIHTDTDLAATWQSTKALISRPKQFEVAFNVAMYAVDKVSALPYRGAVHWPKAPKKAPGRRISIVRLKHSGNWNPEPLAYVRFANMMGLYADTALDVGKPIDITGLTATASKIAVMTGVGPWTFGDSEKAALKKFVEDGGTLVIDAAGGSKAFAKSVEAMLKEVFPAVRQRLRRLATTSALYNLPGMEIRTVGFKRRTGINRIDRLPELRTVLVAGDRPGVIYSPLDLTAGLLGARAYTIDGYDPVSAFELMRNIVIFAAEAKTPAARPPKAIAAPGTGDDKTVGAPGDQEW